MSLEKVSAQVQELIKWPSNILQTLSRMLQRECKNSDVFIEPGFIPFYLSAIPFNNNELFRSTKPEEIFANMKRFVADKRQDLATHKTVSLNTLKLQYFFFRGCFVIEAIYRKSLKEMNDKGKHILKDIYCCKPKTIETREWLLKKITALVILDNGFGLENDKETETAVKSVFSQGDFDAFAKLKKRNKMDVLEDLKVIVCGIRLFNNDAGHEKGRIVDRK